MNEQEILTEALAKADVLFGMRKMLQQYGIPCTEPMTVTLNFGEKAVETKKFPGMPNPMPMAISDEDMKTAILDFLNKADVMYGFMGQISSSSGKPKEPVTITFKYGDKLDNEVSVSANKCTPCPFNPYIPCCLC